jgi:hemoglobin/transferrin/lactoferrin receptor protein
MALARTAVVASAWALAAVFGADVAAEELNSQGMTDSDTTMDNVRTDSQRLDPVSVTATRNPIKAFEYPGMVTVIGRCSPSAPIGQIKLIA